MSDQQVVLIVDDEQLILKALKRLFREREDLDVIQCSSGEEALEVLAQRSVDLILSDHRMPGMDGLELLEHVSIAYPHIPRILFTGSPTPKYEENYEKSGLIWKVISKPWKNEELLEVVDAALSIGEPE